MSKLISDDIRTARVLSSCERSVPVHARTKAYTPFSEFDDSSDCDSLHFGDCPGLTSELKGNVTDEVRLVLLSVVVPNNSDRPFIVFFVMKDGYDTWAFPSSGVKGGGLNRHCIDFVRSFRSSYSRLGYFSPGAGDGGTYAVYEIDTVSNSDDELCGNAASRGIWVTANEILSGDILGYGVSADAVRFVTDIGEGITRLYKNGKFIPGPRVCYVDADYVEALTRSDAALVGNFAYAVVKTFFSTSEDGETPVMVFGMTTTSGTIKRVATWDDTSEVTEFVLESPSAGQSCSYSTVRAHLSNVCFLSSHTGCITTNGGNACEVLCKKMFIFE
jgi:hypothetical protein